MKIVCDACGAKYSIADEKVAGKVFKIRCKKCSNIIVVRGTDDAPQEAAPAGYDEKETRVFDYAGYDDGAGPVWHLVIDQEQVGPLSAAEVQQKFSAGEIDADTYTWKEGFADWLPLVEVPEFAGLAQSPNAAAAAAAAAPAGDDAAAGMFGGPEIDDSGTARSDPADLFAAAANEPAGGDDMGGDLFGAAAVSAPAASGSMADSLFGGGGDEPEGEDEPRLRGQRNENSVLFSLNNLAALASPDRAAASAPSSSPAPSSSGGGGGGAGMAQMGGGEGSGLIDIRSMANAYLADKSAPGAPGAPAPATGGMDDLPSFASTSFDQPAAVLLPTAASSGPGNSKVIYALFGIIAALLIAAVVLVLLVLRGGDKKEPAVAANSASGAADKADGTGDDKPDLTKADDKSGADDKAADDKAGADDQAADDKTGSDDGSSDDKSGSDDKAAASSSSSSSKKPSHSSSRSSSHRSSSRSSHRSSHSSSSHSSSSSRSSSRSSSSSKSSGKCDEVSCLLADNPPPCCKKYRGGSSKSRGSSRSSSHSSSSNSNLPEKLTRSDISSGMSAVRGRVSSCGDKNPGKGTVKVHVKVGGSGKVSSVQVKSSPSSALGSCVASAVKRAHFKKTQGGGSFTYPFVFR